MIKLGSSIVADGRGQVRSDVLRRSAISWPSFTPPGASVVVVTSGAIARGMGVMEIPLRPRAVDELQAASAVGQGKLYQVYDELLRGPGRAERPGAADVLRHQRAAPTTSTLATRCASCSSGGSCR